MVHIGEEELADLVIALYRPPKGRGTYTVVRHCNNCGRTSTLRFPRGQKVPFVVQCPHCDCVMDRQW